MTDKKEIKGAYEELKGVLSALSSDRSWFEDKGFSDHLNKIINRISSLCPEIQDINSYIIIPEYSSQVGHVIRTLQTKSKMNALIGRLRGMYELETPISNGGATFIQNQSQTNPKF